MFIFLRLSERKKTLFTFIVSHAALLNIVLLWSSCFSLKPKLLLLLRSRKELLYKQHKQSCHPFDIVLSIKKIKKTGSWPDFRFIRVEICMLRPINFSWLSHYEHSQAEGANAKLICVLKLLSQASITGKCSDYSLGTKESMESTAQ